jgi:hypothetical protein
MAACLVAVVPSCSNKQESAGFDRIFERLSRAKSYKEIRQCYTSGTIAAVEDAVAQGVLSEKDKLSLLPRFNDKMKWEEIQKRVEGSRGMVRIRYSDHPSQNMIGFTMDFRMKRENDSWRIDLEDEMRAALQGRRSGNPADYIRHVKKKY